MAKKNLAEIFLPDELATIEFGKSLAPMLREGMILSLVGDLGAGKTTLVKGLALAWGGAKEDISSPTFSIVHDHVFPQAEVLHCDFYRLDPEKELEDLGGLEFFFQKKIFVVEWLVHSGIIELIDKKQIVTISIETKNNTRVAYFDAVFDNS